MELNITNWFNSRRMSSRYLSASVAEIGDNAGQITWEASQEEVEDWILLDTEEKKDAFRAFVKSSGGWSEEETAAWNDAELNALLLQWIAGDIREAGLDCEDPDWISYQNLIDHGQVAGNLFGGPMSTDGQVYFSIYA